LFAPRAKHLHRVFETIKQLCIPTSMRHKIAISMHDCNGHAGIDRLYNSVKTRFWFAGMYTFLKQHVLTCLECQQAKHETHAPQVPILPLNTPEPCLVWAIDSHGPFKLSEGKYKHILAIVDHTSLWPELVPIEDCQAETVARAFFDHVIARHGLPHALTLRSDNASSFTSKFLSMFCKTFSVTQVFSSPYHHQPLTRAEQCARSIHSALRILCDSHNDWSKHLQAVALGLRSTASTSSKLSPYEIMFGKRMPLAVDISLMPTTPTVSSPEAYAREIGPKLEILRHIAMQNVEENASRQRDSRNKTAVTPTYKAGDIVLLHDTRVKPNESAKLKKKFAGPFIIISCEPHFNYKLKHLVTGKELKRAVHATRLRKLRQLDDDYRTTGNTSSVCLYAGKTARKHIDVKVLVGNIATTTADVLVSPQDDKLSHRSGAARALARAAGETMVQECDTYLTDASRASIATPLFTSAGSLSPAVTQVLHIVGPDARRAPFTDNPLIAADTLAETYYACLKHTNNRDALASIAIPIIGTEREGFDAWTSAHAAIKAVQRFDADSALTTESLRLIKFVMLTLSTADVFAAVCREILTGKSSEPPESNETSPSAADAQTPSSPTASEDWHEIDHIVRHRKYKGRDQYLVQWRSDSSKSWIDRADVSDAALQHFYATRRTRRRRRQRC
jgi:O-acetyl-ADP-ribose deacetylase (regulator of RNase III)